MVRSRMGNECIPGMAELDFFYVFLPWGRMADTAQNEKSGRPKALNCIYDATSELLFFSPKWSLLIVFMVFNVLVCMRLGLESFTP